MCLIVFGWKVHAAFPLVVAANRDEFYQRPTAQAAFWEEQPGILAGRDLECMGTWMGVTRTGRFAAVTNFRDPDDLRTSAESRGTLVSRFLAGEATPQDYIESIAANSRDYRGFNLLASDGESLVYYTNRAGGLQPLSPGVYGLSNHMLDTPWPKLTTAKRRLEAALLPQPAAEPLFTLMADTTLADESAMPRTGIPPERERMLSAARIVSESYGTRCSTVLLHGTDGEIQYAERTYGPGGSELDTVRYQFQRDA